MGRFRSLSLAIAWTVVVAGLFGAKTEHAAAAADDKVKLSGCLVRGEGDDGYLLINVPAEPAASTASSAPITPTAVGTSGSFANVFYWLDDEGDLKQHIGHQVEIEGDLKGDVKDGELKIDRKDDWTEMEIKSDGKGMKARVPNSSVVAGPSPDKKMSVLVRKVDVEKVGMLAATCK